MTTFKMKDGRRLKVEEETCTGMAGEPCYYYTYTVRGEAVTLKDVQHLLKRQDRLMLEELESECYKNNHAMAISFCI